MTVLACFDGAGALSSAYAQGSDVWGAILDPHLPSLDGVNLARALVEEAGISETFILPAPGSDGLQERPQPSIGLAPDELQGLVSPQVAG
jgi:hypothetical protein